MGVATCVSVLLLVHAQLSLSVSVVLSACPLMKTCSYGQLSSWQCNHILEGCLWWKQ